MRAARQARAEIEAALVASPDLYFAELDLRRRVARFVRLSRAEYEAPTFLPGNARLGARSCLVLDFAELLSMRLRALGRRRVRWLFHTGYCGSTLLCRCLQALGGCLVLKEPEPLLALAFAREHLVHLDATEPEALLDVAVALCSRTHAREEMAIVKPSAQCNTLMPALLDRSDDPSGLFLYSTLESYLCQVLKRADRRALARNRARLLVPEAQRLGPIGTVAAGSLSDARSAAFVWLVRIASYARWHARGELDGVRSLDGDAFIAEPRRTLAAVARRFGLDTTETAIERALEVELRRHAKQVEVPFGARQRAEEMAEVRVRHRDEIRDAVGWIAPFGLPALPLPGAL